MKKLLFTAAIIFGCLTVKIADAQITISAGINIGSQPEWGPVGYDHADYYYFPEIDCYYDIAAHRYVFNDGGYWRPAHILPARFHFDRYRTYKVVVNEPTPWRRPNVIRARYASYRDRHDQVIIRDSREERYRNHWHDNGNHNGDRHDHDHRDRGHGRGHGHDRD